jgi:hypothetical protein|tara:strand:+ start:350 stop:613 length:264 start_codon:yes stop_codon:yes gene_type:complete
MAHYASLMIAPVAVGLGKTTVKFPAVALLSAPKSKTQTALFEAEELYIRHPLAVTVAVPNVRSEKSHTAVVPAATGVTLVKFAPPAV